MNFPSHKSLTTKYLKSIFLKFLSGRVFLSVFLALWGQSALFSQTVQIADIEHQISELGKLPVAEFRGSIVSIYLTLDEVNDPEKKLELSKQLFEITKLRDEESHITSLAYPEIYPDSTRRRYLNEALYLARKLDNSERLMWVEERRSRFFIQTNRFDSAMVCILKLRDFYELNDDIYRKLNLNHLLGDIYYHANLYKQASETYIKVLDYYSRKNEWNDWRPYVLMNNLGQIGLHTYQTESAHFWFDRSDSLANKFLITPDHINIKTYILVKKAETFLLEHNITKANEQLELIVQMPEDKIRDDVRQEILLLESKIYLYDGNYSASLQKLNEYATEYCPGEVNLLPPQVLLMYSELFKKLGNPLLSLDYLSNYQSVSDSLNKRENINRSLILLAEKDHENIQLELALSKKRNAFYLVLFSIAFVFIVFVLLLYRRLFLSQRRLVSQTVKSTRINSESQPNKEKEEFKDLVAKLEKIMEEKKLYLDPQLTIQKTAEYLETNRSYLSKAINTNLNTNFPGYINDLRIKETIRLISEGAAINLTLEVLAENSGFANRSVFISAFKKYTGVTPSFFIKNYNA